MEFNNENRGLGMSGGQEVENPKEACGGAKPPMFNVSPAVLAEVGLGMCEGGRKYGAYNFRATKVKYSTYYDAVLRHFFAYHAGEDIDPDSGVPHISKLIASAIVLRDAEIHGMLIDDRPPKTPEWHKEFLQKIMDGILERHPESVPAFTELGQSERLEEDATKEPNYSLLNCFTCKFTQDCRVNPENYKDCRKAQGKV